MFKGIEFFKGKSRGAEYGLLRFARNDACYVGRSMIEMLGVLAIVGVLSVGGIAGYSKAMEKFKINKLINEYNMLIAGLVEHKSEFPLVGDDPNGHYPLSDMIKALNLVPETWKYINSEYLEDSFGSGYGYAANCFRLQFRWFGAGCRRQSNIFFIFRKNVF